MSLCFTEMVHTHLHDQEVGVVDIQLDTVKQILHLIHLCAVTLDQVLVATSQHHLSTDRDLVILLISNGTTTGVLVVKHQRYARLRNARLSLFVHQLLQILHTHLANHFSTPQNAPDSSW